MAIQLVVDTLDSVPEALRGEYKEVEGKFHLTVDGLVPKARLDEFRNTNISTRRELDALKAQYDGVDVEAYRTLTAKEAAQRDKKLIAEGDVDALVNVRVAAMKADHDKLLGVATAERDATRGQLQGLLIDGALKDAAVKAGVTPTGIEDVVLRGRNVFKLHEGKATAFDGEKAMYGKDGESLNMGEWLGGLAERAPHLFAASQGGGAPKGGPGQAGSNTMTRAQFNALPLHERAAAVKGKTLTD